MIERTVDESNIGNRAPREHDTTCIKHMDKEATIKIVIVFIFAAKIVTRMNVFKVK